MSESEASCLQIRPLEPAQIPLVTAWARQEGFMPGSGDVAIYRQTDRQGIWVAWLNDRPIGCIAGVRYNAAYGFIGLFIVRPDQRGHGYGIQLWRHALDHLSDVRCIGLEAAPDRIADYASWGFQPASPTQRWQLNAPSNPAPALLSCADQSCADQSCADQSCADLSLAGTSFAALSITDQSSADRSSADRSPDDTPEFRAAANPDSQADHPATNTRPGHGLGQGPRPGEALPLALVTAEALPEAALQAYDASHEATPRPHFLRDWLRHPAGTVWALIDPQQRCHGFGRIRPCQLPHGQGWRIGPLIADSPQLAERLLVQLLQHHPGAVLIDAPGANPAAASLLRSRGFSVVGETLRMYRGPIPQLPLQDVFGLACLELG